MTWKQGVDILSFGATKNGCLMAEAIVVFKPALAEALGLPLPSAPARSSPRAASSRRSSRAISQTITGSTMRATPTAWRRRLSEGLVRACPASARLADGGQRGVSDHPQDAWTEHCKPRASRYHPWTELSLPDRAGGGHEI